MLDDIGRTAIRAFEFETVTVNGLGQVRARQSHRAEQFIEDLGDVVSLEMVLIPAGAFRMGSPDGEGFDDEHPRHQVSVPAFLLAKTPVTQAQWQAVMSRSPPYRCEGANRPADRVSWEAAREFCRRLSEKTRRAYRLPSEAEWEYACRAGTTTPFHFGETITTELANYVGAHTYGTAPKGIYRHVTTDVASFPPNAFGLYDMHGNVWEWCADAWHPDYAGAPADGRVWDGLDERRVLRGGCWHDPPDLCRSGARLASRCGEGEDYFGFRVALTSAEERATAPRLSRACAVARRIRDWLGG
jgi:formylglycine-generating enzyme required for sulfatase activity